MNSFWLNSTKTSSSFHQLSKNLDTEVCIIGAGITGLSTGYYLASKGISTVILDKQGIGERVSGHTTAKITSQHDLFYDYLIQSFGHDFAKDYLDANELAITNIEDIIKKEKINCDFQRQDAYLYTQEFSQVQKMKNEVAAVTSLDFPCKLLTTIPLPITIQAAIKFPNQAQFHPKKYMDGLARAILEKQGSIYTHTKVVAIKKKTGGYIVHTDNHQISCQYVVLATHYPIKDIPGFYFLKMYQETSYIMCVKTNNRLFDGMFLGVDEPVFSFRTVSDSSLGKLLLIGGNGHKTGVNQQLDESYVLLEKKVKELYPDAKLLYKWNTEDCIALDKLAYIGEFSSFLPNMFLATGFKKWGMTTSNIAATIIADSIVKKQNRFAYLFKATRYNAIKNHKEVGNMLKQTVHSLVLNKFKVKKDTVENIPLDTGRIIQIEGKNVGIYKDKTGKVFAVNPNCTHLGCLVTFNNLDKTWDCPCHGSRFHYDGTSFYDPSTKNLEVITLK